MKTLIAIAGWLIGLATLFFALMALLVSLRYIETVGTWDGEY